MTRAVNGGAPEVKGSKRRPVPRVRHPQPPTDQPAVLDRQASRRGQPRQRDALDGRKDFPLKDLGVGALMPRVPRELLGPPPCVRLAHLPLGYRALARVDSLGPEPCERCLTRSGERTRLLDVPLGQAHVAVGPIGFLKKHAA